MEFPEVDSDAKVGARAMLAHDHASAALGMKLVDFAPGRAQVTMPIRQDMLNGFQCVHGGITFALADTAFAIACNDDDSVTLAAGAEITYLRPVVLGEVLTATAREVARAGRSGVFDVTVADSSGRTVAEFRGHSRRTNMAVPGSSPAGGGKPPVPTDLTPTDSKALT
jgi:acyl-CoA thioesterase